MDAAVVVSIVLGVAATLGGVYAVFRTSARSNTVDLYEKELDLRTEINARLESEKQRLQSANDRLTEENAGLRGMVTQRANVEELAKMIEHEQRARREAEEAIQMLLKDVVAQLKNRRGEIG